MKVSLAAIADYASVSADGKLSVMGIFNVIFAFSLPATHPQLRLAIQFEVEPKDLGTTQHVVIRLLDPDGDELLRVESDAPLPTELSVPAIIPQVLDLNLLTFQKEGQYQFFILIDGEERASLPLRIVLLPPPLQES